MVNIEVLKENKKLIQSVRQNLGVDSEDESKDEKIAKMNKAELFDRYLTWNGFMHYSQVYMSTYNLLKEIANQNNGYISHDLLASSDLGNKIIEDIRQNQGFPDFESPEFNDQEFDNMINNLTAAEAFDKYLTWNGTIGYSHSFIKTLETLEKAEQ